MGSNLFPLGWLHYLAGGVCIGAGVAWLFIATGRVGGMSSVFSTSWSWLSRGRFFQQARFLDSRGWRLVYAAGLVLGAAAWWLLGGDRGPAHTGLPAWQLLLGGVVAGYGARLANGCTSGHGLCGLGSLQVPSLGAVLVFIATGMLTARAMAALFG